MLQMCIRDRDKIVTEGGRNFLVSHRNHLVLEILDKAEIASYFTEVVTSETVSYTHLVETFVIGGGISAQPILIEEVNRQFDKVHHEIDFIGKIIKRPEIVACHHHNGANLIGAAYFLKQK